MNTGEAPKENGEVTFSETTLFFHIPILILIINHRVVHFNNLAVRISSHQLDHIEYKCV